MESKQKTLLVLQEVALSGVFWIAEFELAQKTVPNLTFEKCDRILIPYVPRDIIPYLSIIKVETLFAISNQGSGIRRSFIHFVSHFET